MGWELTLNAIPAQWALLDRVRNSDIDAQLLCFFDHYYQLRRVHNSRVSDFAGDDRGREQFVDALEQLVEIHPGIENRHCYLGRRFEWLKWLLAQSAGDEYERAIASYALEGESPISTSAKSTQGLPIRSTSAETCRMIQLWLEGLTIAKLRTHYDPPLMARANLYKWGQSTDTESAFNNIAEDFAALSSFYREIATNAEAVLVIVD